MRWTVRQRVLADSKVIVSPRGDGLLAHLAQRQVGEDLRVALSGDQRLEHRPSRLAEDVGLHGGELDEGVFEKLLQSLPVAGTVLYELGPQPGVVPKLPDFRWRDERSSEHAAFVQLGEPDR